MFPLPPSSSRASLSLTPSKPKIVTIQRGSKTLSLVKSNQHYVLGFKTAVVARRVMHNLHPEPQFELLRNHEINIVDDLVDAGFADLDMTIDVTATLFIPKFKGSSSDPMNDGSFHLSQFDEEEFMLFPITKKLGLVLPSELIAEDENEFVYKSVVIDPVTPTAWL